MSRSLRAAAAGLVAAAMGLTGVGVVLSPVTAGAAVLRPARPAARIGVAPLVPRGAKLLGALASSTPLRIEVRLQPRDPAALAKFATEVSTPGSPLYRRYLSAGKFPFVFGPVPTSIHAVEVALTSKGLRVGALSGNHLGLSVSGTAGQIGKAFSLSFRQYKIGGRTAFANTAAPKLPGSIASFVQGVIGLDNLYRAQNFAMPGRRSQHPRSITPHVVTGGPQPCAAAVSAAPNWSAYTADQFASAYKFSSLYQAQAPDLGAGATVALFELAPNSTSDIANYQACYRTSTSVSYTQVDGGSGASGTGAGIEPTLDIEEIIGLAPKANVDVYQGPNTNTGLIDTYSAIVTNDTAQVVSTSWGTCEPQAGSSIPAAENTLFQQAAAQGQTVLAAAGDSGSTDCTNSSGSPLSNLAVDDPASQPYVTGVGGTYMTAIGPPPTERVWNESANSAGAGGGGISQNWPMPSYQASAPTSLNVINANSSGTPCAAATGSYCRQVPDVSAAADPYSGYLIYYTGTGDGGSTGWVGIGGTSMAAPIWAAFAALTDASSTCAGPPIGFANPALYGIAGSSAYSGSFQDITTPGNNDYAPSGYLGGLYPTANGYSMATGLGTPNASGLSGQLCGLAVGPQATTEAATSVTTTQATLNGTVNPNGAATTYQFQYGTTTSYGLVSPASPASAGSGTTNVAESAALSGLTPNTTYDFRLVASNSGGATD
ncbi:MAG: protease pro-enzyme activation domain-containing protein, partial [Acidimicrobiales bacterium]